MVPALDRQARGHYTSQSDEMKMRPASLSTTVHVTKALAHAGRLRILAMLSHGELCVCQMTAVLRLAPSTVSAHLSDLRRSGLIVERKDAKWVHYRLTDDEALRRLARDALSLAAIDPQIREDAKVVNSLRRIPVETLCRAGLDLHAVGIRGAGRAVAGTTARRR
jgi:DNA-binding transcriptional ArsR family regulator